MSDPVYAHVVLRGPDDWQRFMSVVKPNAGPAVERGKPLHAFLVDGDMDRLDIQVAFYWAAVLPRIAEEVPEEDGELRTAVYWHEKLALEFLGMEEYVTKSGALTKRRKSIARGKISISNMAKYTTRVQAWAATNYAIEWDF
jgi:hypothetical protein